MKNLIGIVIAVLLLFVVSCTNVTEVESPPIELRVANLTEGIGECNYPYLDVTVQNVDLGEGRTARNIKCIVKTTVNFKEVEVAGYFKHPIEIGYEGTARCYFYNQGGLSEHTPFKIKLSCTE